MAAHLNNHWCFSARAGRIVNEWAPFLAADDPVGVTYEAAKKRAAPYDKIVGELPEMRAETVTIVREAMRQRVPAYVLVNNRTEGNAPLTIQALVDMLNQDTEPPGGEDHALHAAS